MRTTLDIDKPVLEEVRRLRLQHGGTLGQVVTELLSEALAHRQRQSEESVQLMWISKPMKARVDLVNREAVYPILDQDTRA